MDKSITHIRPRFRFDLDITPEEVLSKVQQHIDQAPDFIEGQIVDNHIILDIVGDQKHFWSPHLNFRVEQDEEGEHASIVRGLIGPNPTVWTLFVFFYFSIFTLGLIGSIIGLSNWMLGDKNLLVWAFPLTGVIGLTAYKAGKLGEKLGADQVESFKQFLRDALDL